MSIPFPNSTWPAVLDERGPSEDPSILLTGTARIGGAMVHLIAIRINPALRSTADYRFDVAEERYRQNELKGLIDMALEDLDALVGEFDELLAEDPLDVVEFAGHPYMIWLVSAVLRS
jgi:hypothetical protein